MPAPSPPSSAPSSPRRGPTFPRSEYPLGRAISATLHRPAVLRSTTGALLLWETLITTTASTLAVAQVAATDTAGRARWAFLAFYLTVVVRSLSNIAVLALQLYDSAHYVNTYKRGCKPVGAHALYWHCMCWRAVTLGWLLSLGGLFIYRLLDTASALSGWLPIINGAWLLFELQLLVLPYFTFLGLLAVFRYQHLATRFPFVPMSVSSIDYHRQLYESQRAQEAKASTMRLTRKEIESLPCQRFQSLVLGQYCGDATTCAVCLCDFEPRDRVRPLRCKHLFHSQCIDPWLQRKGSCPCCVKRAVDRVEKPSERVSDSGSRAASATVGPSQSSQLSAPQPIHQSSISSSDTNQHYSLLSAVPITDDTHRGSLSVSLTVSKYDDEIELQQIRVD